MKSWNICFILGLLIMLVSLFGGLSKHLNGKEDILFFITASFLLWIVATYFWYQMMKEENKNG